MNRRALLKAVGGATAAVGTAGCLRALGFRTRSAWRDPPLVENRPNGVYVPAITEEMARVGTKTVDGLNVTLTYSYPHRFWTLTGRRLSKTVVESDDSLHLMATVWDPKTGGVVPLDSSVDVELSKDGGWGAQEAIYPMLSQQMGYHHGANFALDGKGTYRATVSVGGAGVRRTGAFAGRFGEARSATFQFRFSPEKLTELGIRRYPDRRGRRGAVKPMEMGDVPVGRAPRASDLPGEAVGRATSDDAAFLVRRLDGSPASDGANGAPYLAASARTPHNGIVLPQMAVAATVTRGGTTVFDGRLAPTLDSDLGYHYGATVDSLEPGDEIDLRVPTPPQTARHDGYETAFVQMKPMRLTV